MKLIIGGAYQGKLDYARNAFGLETGWADGRTCAPEEIAVCRGIHHFHSYVQRMLRSGGIRFPFCGQESASSALFSLPPSSGLADLNELGRQAENFAEELLKRNGEIIIVTDELGYGIVPLEKEDRLWREACGRICTCLASRADEVIRVVCGIGVRLK